SVNDDSSKKVETKNSDSCKEKGDSVSDLYYEDFHSSKRVRVVDEKDDYFEYCDEGTSECNKDSTVEGDKFKENIARNIRSSKCSFEGLNKGKEKVVQPVVHNTRKWSESSKNFIFTYDEICYNCD
ncbi:38351_t:CDS:2, partial [Gigaspora margarita]